MNTLSLQKKAVELRSLIRSAKRTLLEFEVTQSKWEYKQGYFKVYKSGKSAVRAALKR